VIAELRADLRGALEGWPDPVAFGPGLDGAFYAAARSSSGEALVVRADASAVRTMKVSGVPLAVSHVQPLPGDRVLLVDARCPWGPEGPARNAAVVDWQGRVTGKLTLGDGIEDVRVAPDGAIWVSYFDEGVFSAIPDPIGAPGLVAFDASGATRFAFDAEVAGGEGICDAYALNVTADGAAWVYYYSEFPIVRVQSGRYRSWPTTIEGARALAIHGDRALLYGSYGERRLATVVDLANEAAEAIGQVRVECPPGTSADGAVVFGVGDELVFFSNRQALVARGWW
jgi:hypothetical protein